VLALVSVFVFFLYVFSWWLFSLVATLNVAMMLNLVIADHSLHVCI